jgi:hypothetical protein
MNLTARQCMLICKLLEETKIPQGLVKEYAIIMDLFLAERENRRREEEEW